MNVYYYDGAIKKGPISIDELKRLALVGIIEPETVLESETGQKAKAGTFKVLVFGQKQPEPEQEPELDEYSTPDAEPESYYSTESEPIPEPPSLSPETQKMFAVADPREKRSTVRVFEISEIKKDYPFICKLIKWVVYLMPLIYLSMFFSWIGSVVAFGGVVRDGSAVMIYSGASFVWTIILILLLRIAVRSIAELMLAVARIEINTRKK